MEKRYFYVSYHHPQGVGFMTFFNELGEHINLKYVLGAAADICKTHPQHIIIMNMYEFKNEEDYLAFYK